MVHTIWLVRHGMRLNFENPDWEKTAERPYDSPLSATGHRQAAETAFYLKNRAVRHVFASPFYRTLQTAHAIAEELELPLLVEHGFYEWLNPAWIPELPEIVTREEALAEFPRIDSAYRSYSGPGYPEEEEDVHVYRRVKPAIERIIEDYEGSIAIVGHGASMHQTARALVQPLNGFNRKMCALNRLERQRDGWRLVYASTAHLSVSEM
ncbi:histidine phosphatase family protein [Paenibacillus koleovorans]|uniref:histidine phosphatase family protein n=1 Tax=Paenibacillus koleovorans TaxID=121608 RepID=UPI000FD70E02|nr:histidine phosphatase family protein [Paenibacillus koleovorans]